MSKPRIIAAQCIQQVVEQGASLSAILDICNEKSPLVQELCYGGIRYYFELNDILQQLLGKPIRNKDKLIHYLLLLGIYQLRYLNIPAHAAVSETVNCAKTIGKSWAKNLINAVLRNYQRQKFENLTDEQACFNHPQWLIDHYKQAWPEHWQDILHENNQRAPLSLRINNSKISTTEYLSLLTEQQFQAKTYPAIPSAIILEQPCPVEQLPKFKAGYASVQDLAAQRCAYLLGIKAQDRVLDACSAPGGKTCHLLELNSSIELTAIDIEAIRNQRTQENLSRLHLQAKVINANAADVASWWDQQLFDCILLDAPCSATGVIRRHSDIKLLRKVTDIDVLQKTQLTLLQQLWKTLKPQGRLLYTTCSVLPDENDQVIKIFLTQQQEAATLPISLEVGLATQHGWQILPGQQQMDGFYYCLLSKK